MKRGVRPPSLGNACATCEVAWEPSSRAANCCIERTCPAAVPALQAQREPFAGPDDQEIMAIQMP